MEIVRDPAALRPPKERSVVTIGAYDGVHVGHRKVIASTRALAASVGAQSVVVTFDRHPAEVVRPESAPKLLTDLEQKLELLASTGIDRCVVVPFDIQRATESATDFVLNVLVRGVAVRSVVVGGDFHFGKGREGNVAFLRELGASLDLSDRFDVVGLELVDGTGNPANGPKVSSTQIRSLLREADARAAATLLGRPHEVRGVVVHGDARGRTLGFPTANVAVPENICLPADGIYAAWYIRQDGARLPAAVNLGRRPTFYDAQPYSLLEAFVLDFSGDLYDEPARVQFVERLRPEAKFDSLDALITQMHADVNRAREVLDAET